MAYPIKICSICSEEFQLKPGKPGYANRCPACSAAESEEPAPNRKMEGRRKTDSELNSARRKAMRDLLYRKDS